VLYFVEITLLSCVNLVTFMFYVLRTRVGVVKRTIAKVHLVQKLLLNPTSEKKVICIFLTPVIINVAVMIPVLCSTCLVCTFVISCLELSFVVMYYFMLICLPGRILFPHYQVKLVCSCVFHLLLGQLLYMYVCF